MTDVTDVPAEGPVPQRHPGPAVAPGQGDDDGWQRLDPRKLLLDPVKAVGQFLVPAVIAVLGISSSRSGLPLWAVPLLILAPILLGVLPWLTTRYRITDTQFQQRKGLLNKKQLTAPLDRIRSVDLEATLLHRLLGLAKVQIGTGVDDTRITLDALAVPQAEELRRYLLARTAPREPALDAAASFDGAQGGLREAAPAPSEVLARIDWSWLRFAPFSLSRLAVVAGAVGVLSQLGDELPIVAADNVTSAWGWLTAFALPLVIVSVLLAGAVGWTVVSVAGYVLQWWALLLVRERGLVRLTAGLFTTRSTSVEEARIRGVELTEPVLLRLVGGGELATLATGVGEGGVTKVLPPCPVEVAVAVGHTLLEEDGPLVAPLVSHGRLARRRCHLRAQWPTLGLTALSIVPILVLDLDWWIALVVLAVVGAVGLLTAEMEWRHLGHTLTDQHLVVGSGALERTRTALERDGVIGWVVSQSLFQRRLGLATLTATTAAGAESVTVRDLALERAVALADATTPHLLADFLVHAVVRPPASGERPGSTVPAGRGQQ